MSGVTPQQSLPFQGLSTWQDVQAAYANGTLSTSDALTIMQSMQASQGVGVPPVTLAAPSGSTTTPASSSTSVWGQAQQNVANELSLIGTVFPAANVASAAVSGGKTPAASSGIIGWIQSNIANYGVVLMGAVLVLGALLVSQKNTVITLSKTLAE